MTPVLKEDTEVIIGKYYMVPHAKLKHGNATSYVAIIGGKHKDQQFGTNKMHWHVDGRFRHKYYDFKPNNDGKTNQVVWEEHHSYEPVKEIVFRRKKCLRLTTGIEPPNYAKKYFDWYRTMIGKSCAGKKCPHLGTTMHESGGELVCPLHDLRGCPTQEIIFPHPTSN